MVWVFAALAATCSAILLWVFARRSRVTLGGKRTQAKSFSAGATAFAPKQFPADEASLVQIYINRPKDQRSVRRAAQQADESAKAKGGTQKLGKIRENDVLSVELSSPNASVEAQLSHQKWKGKPLRFVFWVTPKPNTTRCSIEARILLAGAQIGTVIFTQDVSARPAGREVTAEIPMTPVKRVFLSYSSRDREKVSLIAGAYARAGITCFFDRTSLRSGEEWPPRLISEIERADLFHLFWSASAAASPWVLKETRHALESSRSSAGQSPTITIQMLDGPPWAEHPADLDTLNFDDFTRAAIVGYQRGAAP